MDFRLLRYFIATVEEGSVQGAARRMNIAQPALSRRIRDLELTLGSRLLTRGARGVTVTRAGRAFYEEAVALVRHLDQAIHDVRRIDLEQGRELRFGLVQSARKYPFMRAAIADFVGGQNRPEIAYRRTTSAELLEGLRGGTLDVTLLYERRIRSPQLAERLIHRERYILAAHPDHALAGEGPVSLAQIAGQPLVWLARQSEIGDQDLLSQQCRLHGLEPSVAQLAATHEEQIDLATISGGACLTPAWTLLSTPPGQLLFRPIPDFVMEIDLSLGWVRDMGNPSVAAMLASLHGAIDQHQAALADGSAPWAWLAGERIVSPGDPAPAQAMTPAAL